MDTTVDSRRQLNKICDQSAPSIHPKKDLDEFLLKNHGVEIIIMPIRDVLETP